MSHTEQRVLARLMPDVADRAFSLLRDRNALRELLASSVHDEGGREREFAMALSDGAKPAFLVVTKSGRAVTCLAPGMLPHGPVVEYSKVRAHLDARASSLDLRIAAQKIANDDDGPLERLARSPDSVTRADFELVEKIHPLLEGALQSATATTLDRIVRIKEGRHAVGADGVPALFALARLSSLALLWGRTSPRVLAQACAAASLGDAMLAPVAWWTLVNRADVALPLLATILDDGQPNSVELLAVVRVIGARHAALAPDASRLLENVGADARTPLLDDAKTALVFLLHLPVLLGRYCPASVRDMPPDVRQRLIAAVHDDVAGKRLPLRAVAERLGPWFVRVVDLLDPGRWLTHTSPDVLAAGGAHQGERARILLWQTMLTRVRVPFASLPVEVKLFLTAAPFSALVPREKRRPPTSPETMRAYVQTLAPRPASFSTSPAVSEKTTGRNDPCPCGSGKKFKKCHGRDG